MKILSAVCQESENYDSPEIVSALALLYKIWLNDKWLNHKQALVLQLLV